MTQSKVEEVARAICKSEGYEPDALPNEDFADGYEVQWKLYINDARAAIAAMREPTEKMVWAGWEDVLDGRLQSPHEIEGIYAAMIDAALEE